jgi:hypothetical protein
VLMRREEELPALTAFNALQYQPGSFIIASNDNGSIPNRSRSSRNPNFFVAVLNVDEARKPKA